MDFVRNLSVDELRTFYDGLSETRRKMPNIVRMLRDAQVQLGVVDFLPLEEEQEESDSAPNSEGSADADNGRADNLNDVRERFNELTNVMHQFKKNGNVAIARQHVINTRYFLCLGELFRRFQRMHRALRLRGSVHDAFFERIFGRDSNTSRAAFKNKVTAAATLAELAITFHVLRYATVSVGKLIQFHTELRRLLATASNDGIRWRNNLLTPAIHQGVQQVSDEDRQRLQTFVTEHVFDRQQNELIESLFTPPVLILVVYPGKC
jgi:hypothetical protein